MSVIYFSESSEKYYGFTIFLEKCKQTAEISWLFISDVTISKNFVKQIFSIFHPDVTAYLHLFSQTTQWAKFLYQYPCFVITPIYKWLGCNQQIFYISLSITQFWIFWKKITYLGFFLYLDGLWKKLKFFHPILAKNYSTVL